MTRFLSAFMLVVLAGSVQAQVSVEILFEREQFLRGEPAPVRVRISNFSGQALRLGDEAEWLTFTVTGDAGKALRQTANMPATRPFTIASAKSATVRAELAPYFGLSMAGRYGVSVRVKVPQLDKEFVAPAKNFDILSGATIWQKEVGVPGATPPVVRKYTLQRATFYKQTSLFAQVADSADATMLRVVPLGILTSFSQPEAEVDRASQLHVIFQNGQSSYSYAIVTPDGDQIIRQTYDITTTRPRLRIEDDGRIVVHGGVRRILLSDLPPPPQPVATNAPGPGK